MSLRSVRAQVLSDGQDTLEKIMAQPLEEFQVRDNMKDYIDQKINAIDELLPKWTSLPSDFFAGDDLEPLGGYDDDDEEEEAEGEHLELDEISSIHELGIQGSA